MLDYTRMQSVGEGRESPNEKQLLRRFFRSVFFECPDLVGGQLRKLTAMLIN